MVVEVLHTGGLYAERVIAYLSTRGQVVAHQVPRDLPLIIDDPDEYLPPGLGTSAALALRLGTECMPVPDARIIIAINLHQDLLLEIPRRVKDTARALLAPIEDPDWIKPGLQRQLTQVSAQYGLETAFPKPFCALVPNTPAIQAFCEEYRVGRPEFSLQITDGVVTGVEVRRAAPCSITAFIAKQLVGLPADDTLPEKAGFAHHAYPCLATMNLDPSTGDTVMHASLHLVRARVVEALKQL